MAAVGLATFTANAQAPADKENYPGTTYEKCTYFVKTPPLREMLKTLEPIDDKTYYLDKDPKPVNPMRYGDWSEVSDIGLSETGGVDPALQQRRNQGRWRL